MVGALRHSIEEGRGVKIARKLWRGVTGSSLFSVHCNCTRQAAADFPQMRLFAQKFWARQNYHLSEEEEEEEEEKEEDA